MSVAAPKLPPLDVSLGGVDSVELKLTIPDGQEHSAADALGIDPLEAQIRQIYFFDTPRLLLFNRGVVLRARRIQRRAHDVVVKLRPLEPAQVGPRWRHLDGFKIEIDVVDGKGICSASLRAPRPPEVIKEAIAGQRPLEKLFRKRQRRFLSEHADKPIEWERLRPLGPVNVYKVRMRPKDLGLRVDAELWRYPDDAYLLELSTKVKPEQVEAARERAREFVEGLGLSLGGDQQTKTKRALQFFSRRA